MPDLIRPKSDPPFPKQRLLLEPMPEYHKPIKRVCSHDVNFGLSIKRITSFLQVLLVYLSKNLLWNGLSILLVRAAEFRCRRIFKQFLFTSELTAKLQNFVRFYNWLCAPHGPYKENDVLEECVTAVCQVTRFEL